MFTDFFYLLRAHGLLVSMNEWMTLMEALKKGLADNSLLGFYYLARGVLVKTEADFDKFDQVFLAYFENVRHVDEIPPEFFQWLQTPKEAKPFDKDEVDARTRMTLLKLREMLEERLKEQHSRHDGGQYWIGTGGTSVLGHSGYAATGVRVGGEGGHRHALQIAGERDFKDFREDQTLDLRSFQMAFRHLRQFTAQEEAPRDQLDLEATIKETSRNAGFLKLEFDYPRRNGVKVLLLFDSGGSMRPFTRLCTQLFQAVSQANHFKDLQIYYFHNCIYDRLYRTPSIRGGDSVSTQWVLNNLDRDYKVIFVGDACMGYDELYERGGALYYSDYNEESGLTWMTRLKNRFPKQAWFNPIPKEEWNYVYGSFTIEALGQVFPMYHLSAEGLARGLRHLVAAR